MKHTMVVTPPIAKLTISQPSCPALSARSCRAFLASSTFLKSQTANDLYSHR